MLKKRLLVSVSIIAALGGYTASQARISHFREEVLVQSTSPFVYAKAELEDFSLEDLDVKLPGREPPSIESSEASDDRSDEGLSEGGSRALEESPVLVIDQSETIRLAAIAAAASYNDKDIVAQHGRWDLRAQEGFAFREELLHDGFDVVNFFAIINGKHIPAGILAYKDGQVVVSYHGSECVEDFTEANLRYFRVRGEELGIKGKVHRGFYKRYMQSREAMHEALQDLLMRHGRTSADVNVLVTGHSLGGALATLAAADIHKLYRTADMDVVTFSSPRVVNYSGAKDIESKIGVDRMLRIWRKNDLVPAVVLGLFGWMYKHVGTSMMLESMSMMIGLTDHTHNYNIDEATSEKVVYPKLDYRGYGDAVGDAAVAVVSAPVIAGQAVVSGVTYTVNGVAYGAKTGVDYTATAATYTVNGVVYGAKTGVDYTAAVTNYVGSKVSTAAKRVTSKVKSAVKSAAKGIAAPFKKMRSCLKRRKVEASAKDNKGLVLTPALVAPAA